MLLRIDAYRKYEPLRMLNLLTVLSVRLLAKSSNSSDSSGNSSSRTGTSIRTHSYKKASISVVHPYIRVNCYEQQ